MPKHYTIMAKKLTPELIAEEAKKLGLLAEVQPLVSCTNGKVIRTDVSIRFNMSNGTFYFFTGFRFQFPENEPAPVPRTFVCGSRMDGVPFYLFVGEFDTPVKYEHQRPCKRLFDLLTENGYIEGNNWHCAQWGTWKFHLQPNITCVRKTLRLIKQAINEC